MYAAVLLLPFVGQALAGVVPKRELAAGLDTAQTLISNVIYGGTGCPSSSTVNSSISSDASVVTLTFSDYVATVGPNAGITDSRQNCQLNLNLQYPNGYQYSVKRAEYRGHASLDNGATAQQKSTYYFSGQSAQTSTATNLQGPCGTDYDRVDTAADASLQWSPCGSNAMLNIDSEIDVSSSSSSSNTDYIGTSYIQVQLQWRSC